FVVDAPVCQDFDAVFQQGSENQYPGMCSGVVKPLGGKGCKTSQVDRLRDSAIWNQVSLYRRNSAEDRSQRGAGKGPKELRMDDRPRVLKNERRQCARDQSHTHTGNFDLSIARTCAYEHRYNLAGSPLFGRNHGLANAFLFLWRKKSFRIDHFTS